MKRRRKRMMLSKSNWITVHRNQMKLLSSDDEQFDMEEYQRKNKERNHKYYIKRVISQLTITLPINGSDIDPHLIMVAENKATEMFRKALLEDDLLPSMDREEIDEIIDKKFKEISWTSVS